MHGDIVRLHGGDGGGLRSTVHTAWGRRVYGSSLVLFGSILDDYVGGLEPLFFPDVVGGGTAGRENLGRGEVVLFVGGFLEGVVEVAVETGAHGDVVVFVELFLGEVV